MNLSEPTQLWQAVQAGTNLQFLNLISKNQIQNACWAVPKPLAFCIRRMQAAHFCKMLFNLSADACGVGTFCTDGFPEAENSAMQHIRDCAILDLHKLVCPKKLEVFIDSYESFIAEVYTEPKPLPKSGKSEVDSKTTPEAPEPAKETLTAESPQSNNANAEVIPDVAQMEHILELPKVTCLLLSLAKNAGLSANNSSELAYKGKEFLLDTYQKALKNKTLQINIQKNKITFPMEEHDSGFHAVGMLTRSPAWEYGWKFNYLTENTSGAEKSEVKEKIPPKPLTALEHLERCGYKIVQQVVPKKLPPIAVQRMAWKTGEALCDPVVVDFLQFIRTHMQSDGSFSFRIPKGTSKNSFATLSEIAQTWDKMGLFASIVIYPQNIVYELAQNETVRHFLSGKWLELFVEHQVQQILNRYQEEQGAEVSLCSNVILSEAASAGSTHELDVAFSINGKFFWVEAKSSSRSIDYGKYASL